MGAKSWTVYKQPLDLTLKTRASHLIIVLHNKIKTFKIGILFMAKGIDIVVICGGQGKRISSLTSQFQCKSLIPICGRPAIEYVLHEIRVATSGRIILCVDRRSLVPSLQEILDSLDIKNVQFYMDNGRGPMPAMYEVSGFCGSQGMLVMFGHQLTTATHLTKILSSGRNDAAVSLFRTSSESHCKITSLTSDSVCKFAVRYTELVPLASDQYYIDLPYFLPLRFFDDAEYSTLKRLFIKGHFPATAFSPTEAVHGIIADFPHEFHHLFEIQIVEKFAAHLISKERVDSSWLT
jgi:hypothetical protein